MSISLQKSRSTASHEACTYPAHKANASFDRVTGIRLPDTRRYDDRFPKCQSAAPDAFSIPRRPSAATQPVHRRGGEAKV